MDMLLITVIGVFVIFLIALHCKLDEMHINNSARIDQFHERLSGLRDLMMDRIEHEVKDVKAKLEKIDA